MNKSFCILPWISLQLKFDGQVYPCCRMAEFNSVGNLNNETLSDVWNSSTIKEIRKAMVAGQKLNFCTSCYEEEGSVGKSYRTEANEEFKSFLSRVDSMDPSGTLTESSLPFIDIRFSNICNLKCRTCNVENSTSWHEDHVAMGGATVNNKLLALNNFPTALNEIFSKAEDAEKIFFAGGEPLLHQEHYLLLEHLISSGKTSKLLSYNTNMTSLSMGNRSVIDLWKFFNHIQIGASIDGVGEQFDFIRKGANWDRVKENLLEIKSKITNLGLTIFPTIGALNSFHITDLIQEMINLKLIEVPHNLAFNYLYQPQYLSIGILNSDERLALKNHYQNFLNSLKGKINQELFDHINNELEGILGFMNQHDLKNLRKEFRVYNIKLDKLRGERTLSKFPELFSLLYETEDN